jgi:hypothetical protein
MLGLGEVVGEGTRDGAVADDAEADGEDEGVDEGDPEGVKLADGVAVRDWLGGAGGKEDSIADGNAMDEVEALDDKLANGVGEADAEGMTE